MAKFLDIVFMALYRATGNNLMKTIIVFFCILVFVLVLILGRDK